MQSEALGTAFFGLAIGIDDLVVTHSVFRLDRVADDVITDTTGAGVIAEADEFRHHRGLGDKRYVVEIENTTSMGRRLNELLVTGVVGGVHDILALAAYSSAEDQFRDGTAVKPETHAP